MTITWTETTTGTTVSSREAGLDPDATVGEIYTRSWQRGPAGRRETLTAYVACYFGWHFGVRWEYALTTDGTVANSWTGSTTRTRRTEGPVADSETERVAAELDPTSTMLPADCPAWAWTVADVAEYRGLASADSARRWLHEIGVDAVSFLGRDPRSGAKIYNGHDVVKASAAMVGRGVGGGRPSASTGEAAV